MGPAANTPEHFQGFFILATAGVALLAIFLVCTLLWRSPRDRRSGQPKHRILNSTRRQRRTSRLVGLDPLEPLGENLWLPRASAPALSGRAAEVTKSIQ